MKSYVLCAHADTLVSFRLAGIEGVMIKDKDELVEKLKELVKSKDIGIIIISEKVFSYANEDIMQLKLRLKDTLIIQVPEPGGEGDKDYIMRYIKESIGISI